MSPHDFGFALRALKEGKRVTRPGWNGKGMWLFLWHPDTNLAGSGEDRGRHMEEIAQPPHPCICMKAEDGRVVPGWLASQTDMLAEDWVVVGE